MNLHPILKELKFKINEFALQNNFVQQSDIDKIESYENPFNKKEYNNIHSKCMHAKVFVAEDSQYSKTSESRTPSHTNNNIMSTTRDPTIDYNYFRASKTKQ
jgi:hypothetical protein